MFDPKLYPKHYLIAIWREYCFYSILYMLLLHILSSMHRIHSHVHGHCKPCNLSCQNTCVFQIEWAVPMRSCPLQVCPCPDSLIIKERGKSVNIFDPLFLVGSLSHRARFPLPLPRTSTSSTLLLHRPGSTSPRRRAGHHPPATDARRQSRRTKRFAGIRRGIDHRKA
jgi:hypothetical protein